MKLKINGKEQDVNPGATLLELIKNSGMSPEKVVVEYNKKIMPEQELENTVIKEQDNIEILCFVGGG